MGSERKNKKRYKEKNKYIKLSFIEIRPSLNMAEQFII